MLRVEQVRVDILLGLDLLRVLEVSPDAVRSWHSHVQLEPPVAVRRGQVRVLDLRAVLPRLHPDELQRVLVAVLRHVAVDRSADDRRQVHIDG